MTAGVYLYCLGWADRLPAWRESGPEEQIPLNLGTWGNIAAVWSPVALEEFCDAGAPARLQDLDWIGPRVCRHQRVVQEVMRHSPVLPAGFGTIFSSPERLEGVIREHHQVISRFLDWVAGREEWAVKGLLDRSRAREEFTAAHLAREAETLAALTPGRRYFQEQRLRQQAEQDLSRWLKVACREVLQALQGKVREVRERRVWSPEDRDSGREMLVNWAFLVDREEAPAFNRQLAAAHARYQRWGLAFAVTGPWPPYSFCPALTGEAEG
jgi:hypothetical protein